MSNFTFASTNVKLTPMSKKRNYRLLCPIARALDVLGDRWTLLILRDLQAGPARFQELETGLGLATNLLSSRLAELVDAGLVEKDEADRQSPYVLTALGRKTDRVLWELARFGAHLDRDDDPRPPGNARVIALPLRVLLEAVTDRPALVVQLIIDDDPLTITSSPEAVDVVHGLTVQAPDLVLRTDYVAFLDVGEGELELDDFATNHLQIVDGAEHADAFFELMAAAFSARG